MFTGLSIIEFSERFTTDDESWRYLAGIKWGKGYCCGKCGQNEYYEIKKAGSRLSSK